MVFLVYRLESKDFKILDQKLARCKQDSIIWKRDPGAIGFTRGLSRDSISITVGEQITVEQLIELSIVMRISRYDHVYRHHVRDK